MYGGVASTLSQELLDAGEFDPYKLWASLSRYYDTSLNRANVVLFEIKRHLKLQLDVATTPVQFISDFRDCLQWLRNNKAKVTDKAKATVAKVKAVNPPMYDMPQVSFSEG